jgi:hypothetical protein
MSLRGTRSGPAFRSDGRGLAFVIGNDRGRVAPAAVGKPDKPTLFDVVRKHFWASETILWALQSRLQTVPLRINRPCIAKTPAQYVVLLSNQMVHFQKLAKAGPQEQLQLDRPHPKLAFPPHAHGCPRTVPLTLKRDSYRAALLSRSGDFSFPRSEFRTVGT